MPPLQLTLDGETHIVVTRTFKAQPADVYRAHLEPELIRQWMIAMPGWSMPLCETDSRDGGKFRFEFDDGEGNGFAIAGEYIALTPVTRIEHVERMYLPDPTPDNHVVTEFTPASGGTHLKMVMTLPDAATRAAMLETGMEQGMEESYALLDKIAF